ncbi:PLDc N-terminal domain-containing protein [Agromyces archimandritae]|uniref:PLDc N-terminal domain-containing protein n=1 Tax=Agromyces archimandritae TaxID=2781962 RepID=A0A975FJS9_9MICO|nr:PLDc N-terminal domain-containing protein [Agromyces archimandritae]QTX03828.1 PLDc N-terminal domain-containing protein [Agromyces archimandritae]
MPIVLGLLPLVLMLAALIDLIMRGDEQVRHMPKFVWILLVVLLPLIGSILWFAIGREYGGSDGGARMPWGRDRASAPAPMRAPAPARTTEEQLADLDREIEEERLRRAIAERRRELEGQPGDG